MLLQNKQNKMNLSDRITINKNILEGMPTIRNTRFPIVQIFDLFNAGMSREEILEDYSFLTALDIEAALIFSKQSLIDLDEIHY